MATIDDVAREAGVAISTVSYALSGKRKVSAATRDRIAAACLALDYAPRASARALAANRSEIIAVTAPMHRDTDPSAHMAFAMEVTLAARARDYDTLLLVHDDAQQGMRRSAASALADGIIVLDVAAHDERADLARKLSCPVVFIGLPEDTEGIVCVDLDFEAAIRTSIDALVDRGHTSIGLVSQHRETLERESNYPLRVVHEFERYAQERGISFAVTYPEGDDCDPVLDDLFGALADYDRHRAQHRQPRGTVPLARAHAAWPVGAAGRLGDRGGHDPRHGAHPASVRHAPAGPQTHVPRRCRHLGRPSRGKRAIAGRDPRRPDLPVPRHGRTCARRPTAAGRMMFSPPHRRRIGSAIEALRTHQLATPTGPRATTRR